MTHSKIVVVTGLILAARTGAAQSAAASCEHLRNYHKTSSHILAAEYIPTGPAPSARLSIPSATPVLLPAHCSVRISTATSSDSAVTTDVWLPDSALWNGKLLGTGNGGYSSALSLSDMAGGLQRGFVVAGSDTGHEGDDLSFGTAHPERIRDWAYRSTHVLAEDAKSLITAYYSRPAAHAYFQGCSTGGQQALSEAQRYPRDFDGIVGGDPGNDRILLNADFVSSWLTTHPAQEPAFPASKLALLSHAVIAACDRQDGLADGVIDDPRKCTFDPGALACPTGADPNTCLTAAEIGMVRRLYEGAVRDSAGKSIFPGWPRGSEAGWGNYLISPAKPVRLEFWSSWVYDSPLDLNNFDASAAIAIARRKLPFVEAVDADLRPFQRAGGKLILYHGWADPVVPPQSTIAYYERVEKVLGPDTRKSIRLFMVPGMGHCGGGPGASVFDALSALDRWVTGIQTPDSIVAAHSAGVHPTFERPLCPFPQVARWDGQGDSARASSFQCREERSTVRAIE